MSLALATPGHFADNFNRANSTNLGADWTEVVGTDAQIISNQLGVSGTGEVEVQATALGTLTDIYAEAVWATLAGGPLVWGRATSDFQTGYVVWPDTITSAKIYRRNAGTWTELANCTGFTWGAGNRFGISVEGTGATVSVKAYRNGSQIGATYSDTSGSRITAAGYTGVRLVNDASLRLDSFRAYALATTIVVTSLPTGWYIKVNGSGFAASSGTATATGLTAGTSYALEVWNGDPTSGGVRQDLHTVAAAYPGSTFGYTAASITTDITLCTAVKMGTVARVRWASDPALSSLGNHKVYRNGGLLATVNAPALEYFATGDTAGDVYWVQDSGGSGRILAATSQAITALTVDASDKTSVACSWDAVTGASSYKLYRRGQRQQQEHWRLLYTGTGLSYDDTSTPEGEHYYFVQTLFSDGSSSVSAETTVTLTQSKYVSPNERGLEVFWDAAKGLFHSTDNLMYEHWDYWIEDCAELLWALRLTPRYWSQYAAAIKEGFLTYIGTGGQPLIKKYSDSPLGTDGTLQVDAASPTTWGNWNGSTGAVDTGAHFFQWNVTSGGTGGTTSIAAHPSAYYYDTVTEGDLCLSYKVGVTAYAFLPTTKQVSFDAVNGQVTMDLEQTDATREVQVHYSVVIQRGRLRITGWIKNNKAGAQDVSLQMVDDNGVAGYDVATSQHITVDSTTNGNANFARIVERDTSVARSSTTFLRDWSSVASAATVTSDFIDAYFGEDGFPALATDYTTDIQDAQQGSPFIPAFLAAGLTAWVLKNPADTTAKATLDALLGTLFAYRANGYNPYRSRGWLLWCYAALSDAYPADATYSANQSTLEGECVWANMPSYADARYGCIIGQMAAGNTSAADTIRTNCAAEVATNPTYNLGQRYLAESDKTSAQALLCLTNLARRNRIYSVTTTLSQVMQDANGSAYTATSYGTTGEAMAFAIGAMTDFRNRYGDLWVQRLGRTSYMADGYGPWSDGTISSLAWNAGTRVLTLGVDKDIWLFSGRGKPTAVDFGGGALTEDGSDPGAANITHGHWYWDDAHQVAKIGCTSAQTLNVTAPDVNVALSVSGIDSQGCNLDWSIYAGADFTSYKLWRSTTSNIDGTGGDVLMTTEYDPGVNTYHDTLADPGTTYYYRVELVTTGGSVWSDEETVVTLSAGAFFFRNFVAGRRA